MRAYAKVADRKRASILARLDAAADDVVRYAESQKAKAPAAVGRIQANAKAYAKDRRPYVVDEESCTCLDAMANQFSEWSCQQMEKVDEAVRSEAQRKADRAETNTRIPAVPQPRTKVLRREKVCPIRLLESEEAVDAYVEGIRKKLMDALAECGSVRLD